MLDGQVQGAAGKGHAAFLCGEGDGFGGFGDQLGIGGRIGQQSFAPLPATTTSLPIED